MRKHIPLTIVAATAALFGVSIAAKAQDASFGCKVLLCAAASAPGWSGIPYCVPVMQQLFSSLAHGHTWPTCDQANAGGLQYQPYGDCPAGTGSYSRNGTDYNGKYQGEAMSSNANGALCATAAQAAQNLGSERPANPKPYSITITPNGSSPFTFSFNLTGG